MSLSILPDLCLFAIFDLLPLHDLLVTVNLVCRRWYSLHSTACHRRCHPLIITQSKTDFDRSVGLTENENFDPLNGFTAQDGTLYRNYREICHFSDWALTCSLTLQASEQLVSLLPNVKSVQIIQLSANLCQISHITHLLIQWRLTLVHLKLWFWESDAQPNKENYNSCLDHFSALFHSINSLSLLKHFEVNLKIPSNRASVPIDLSIVSQLERFDFASCGFVDADSKIPLTSLKVHGESNANLTEITIRNIYDLSALSQFSPQFSARFTELHIYSLEWNSFGHFCNRFTSLKVLALEFANISMSQIGKALTNLPQLVHFGLANEVPWQIEHLHRHQLATLPKVVSVKALSLDLLLVSHHDIEALHLPLIFPNTQIIWLQHRAMQLDKFQHSKLVQLFSDIRVIYKFSFV